MTESAPGQVKCVVWDLDDTVWEGVLAEGEGDALRPGVAVAIAALDDRGILQSVASKNDPGPALERLAKLGLADMFLYPQVSWNPKSDAIAQIAASLNIAIGAIAFVDDSEFERAEVAHSHPDVRCLHPAELASALARPEYTPRFHTQETSQRREMYRSQVMREDEERVFTGTSEEFLASLGMVFTIREASEDDLQRAEELTVRTNQLNSTGRTYSYEELDALRASDSHLVIVAELTDRFGSYGTIGLALVEKGQPTWHLRLLLMSCRTMSRGVGTVLLHHIMAEARDAGARLRADFVETGRNRMMRITYVFAGFAEVSRDGSAILLESDLAQVPASPSYVTVVADPVMAR